VILILDRQSDMRYHYLFVKLHSPLHFIRKGEDIPGIETKHPYHRSAVVDHACKLVPLSSSFDWKERYSVFLPSLFSATLGFEGSWQFQP
jgi:hypothetical protein